MVRDLIKVAKRLDELGLTEYANELDFIIRKIASREEERKAFYEMQQELRGQNSPTTGPSKPSPSEAELFAIDKQKWADQQEMDAQDPEAILIEQASTEAKRYARTKHLLFLTKKDSGADHEDTKRLQLKLLDQKTVLDGVLDEAAQISKMCRYNTFKTIQDILTAPTANRRS